MNQADRIVKLGAQLEHARKMEARAGTRVKRASTLLLKWQRKRARIEQAIGKAEVTRIVNRLTLTK